MDGDGGGGASKREYYSQTRSLLFFIVWLGENFGLWPEERNWETSEAKWITQSNQPYLCNLTNL